MSFPVLNSPVPLSVFFAFRRHSQLDAPAEMKKPHNPELRDKPWYDPNPVEFAEGLERAQYTVLDSDDQGKARLVNGKPRLAKIYVPLAEAAALNIPPNVANYARAPQGEWPIPLDMTKWDPENYYLDVDGPFALVVVKDKRAAQSQPAAGGFTEADRAMLRDSVDMLKTLLVLKGE